MKKRKRNLGRKSSSFRLLRLCTSPRCKEKTSVTYSTNCKRNWIKITIRERLLGRHNVWFRHWRLLRMGIQVHVVRFRWGRRRISGNLLGGGSVGERQFDRIHRSCSCLLGTGIRLWVPWWFRRILRGLHFRATHMFRCIRRSEVQRRICFRCIHRQRKCRRLGT